MARMQRLGRAVRPGFLLLGFGLRMTVHTMYVRVKVFATIDTRPAAETKRRTPNPRSNETRTRQRGRTATRRIVKVSRKLPVRDSLKILLCRLNAEDVRDQ